jgi:hypothetical protein
LRHDPWGIGELAERHLGPLTQDFVDGVHETAIEGGPDLAINMLADGLYEYEVPLTHDEVEQLLALGRRHGAELDRITPLRELIA